MNAKKVLNQAFILRCEIKVKQEQISTMQDNLTDISAPLGKERVSRTPEASHLERDITQLIQLECELKEEIARLAIVEQEIMDIINRIENMKARAVLSKHYLGFKSWSDIADEMQISTKWALNLHTKGLRQVETVLTNRDASLSLAKEEY